MGNCFRRCAGGDDDDSDASGHGAGYGGPAPRPPFAVNIVGFTAVPRDLVAFAYTGKVPEALSEYVSASKATQIIWYAKLLAAWRRASPPPSTAEAVALFLAQALEDDNIEGLLRFYHLPPPFLAAPASDPVPAGVLHPAEAGAPWPKDVKFEILTLPVDEATVGDGDGFVAFVDVFEDPREEADVPLQIKDAMSRRRQAQAHNNHTFADALKTQIENAEYKVYHRQGGGGEVEFLARKYRIRLKGVDAPEIGQPYGEEAKGKLIELVGGHKLLIHIYGRDKYGRWLGDVYQKDTFIQEVLLKEGLVWHYKFYDKRKTLAKWERDAKAAQLGLWTDANPEEPWNYRRKQPRRRYKKGGSYRKKGG